MEQFIADQAYSSKFLMTCNNYLHRCWQLYSNSNKNETSYLEIGLSNYKKLAHHFIAELNPYIFHHLACFAVALKQLDEAVHYVLKAFYYGYLQFHLILDDEDLKPIFNHETFVAISNWYEKNVVSTYVENQDWRWYPNLQGFPTCNPLVFDLVNELPERITQGAKYNHHQIDYVSYLMKHFLFPDLTIDATDESNAYNAMLMAFAPFFNKYLQNTMDLSWQEHCAYFFYQDYAITNAKTHLVRLEYLFYKAHNEYGINEMSEDLINDLLNRIQLKYEEASEEDKAYIDNSKVFELLSNIEFVQ